MTLSSMKRYTLDILEDDDFNAYVKLPEELLRETGWMAGDVLEYEEDPVSYTHLTLPTKRIV